MIFSEALKKNHDFRRLYSKGKNAAGQLLVVYCRRNGSKRNRIGYTVSTKLGKAVHRNKVRRRLREIYRLHEAEIMRGIDLVVVARVRSRTASYGELEEAMMSLFRKLDIVTNK